MAQKKKKQKCVKKVVKFRAGREVKSFMAHVGSGCPPRKKPSTAHLRAYKLQMKRVAPNCAKGSQGVKAFRACIKDAFRNFQG